MDRLLLIQYVVKANCSGPSLKFDLLHNTIWPVFDIGQHSKANAKNIRKKIGPKPITNKPQNPPPQYPIMGNFHPHSIPNFSGLTILATWTLIGQSTKYNIITSFLLFQIKDWNRSMNGTFSLQNVNPYSGGSPWRNTSKCAYLAPDRTRAVLLGG